MAQSVLHGIHEKEKKNQRNTVSIRSATTGGGAMESQLSNEELLSSVSYLKRRRNAILADKSNSSTGEPIGTPLVHFSFDKGREKNTGSQIQLASWREDIDDAAKRTCLYSEAVEGAPDSKTEWPSEPLDMSNM